MFKPEIPFTDKEIDQLLLAPTPPPPQPTEPRSHFGFYTPLAPDLATALASSPFSIFSTISAKSAYFNDFFRLLRTGSDAGLQKLIKRNPSLAKDFFPTMCEHKRFAMVDWIIGENIVDVNHIFYSLVEFNCRMSHAGPDQAAKLMTQLHEMLPDKRITASTVDRCLDHTCLSSGNNDLFDLFLNDSRANPVHCENSPLSLAALHGREEIVVKLLADARVQACDNWEHVVYSACRQRSDSILRLILDQPKATISRRAARVAKDEKHEWILQHPKYNPEVFVKKPPAELIRNAVKLIDAYDHDRAKRMLNLALAQLENVVQERDENAYEDSDDEYKVSAE